MRCLHQLPLALHPAGQLDPKAMVKDLSDLFQRESAHFRVAKDDKKPTNKADARVEAKGAARRDALHHGQERRGDDDVATPARHRVHHGAESAHFEGQKLRADPGDCGDSTGEEGDVDDDGRQDDDAGPVNRVSFEHEVF